MEKEFNVSIVSNGSFEDQGYEVTATTIRLNPVAMNEWIFSSLLNDRMCYEKPEDWEAYKAEKEAKRQAWENKILEKLGIEKAEGCGCSITQNVSEVFTVVYMEALKSYYFTFGSDPLYPYQNTYLIVKARNKKEAIQKFRARHKDRVEGSNTYNAAFCYGSEQWEGSDNQRYYPEAPAELIE